MVESDGSNFFLQLPPHNITRRQGGLKLKIYQKSLLIMADTRSSIG